MLCNKQTKRNLAILLMATAVLASGLALTAWAKKPENPGGGKPGGGGKEPRYTIVDLGTFRDETHARSINESGQVVGTAINYTDVPQQTFLVTPEDNDGDGVPDTWFRDDDGDGINDLMTDLGSLGGRAGWGCHINDLGQVVGNSGIADTFIYHAFLIVPEDTDGDGEPDTWFRDDDGDGANDLMVDLGSFGSNSSAWAISNSGYVVGSVPMGSGTIQGFAFIIVPEDTDGDGIPDTWFRDADNNGDNDLMVDLGTLRGDRYSSAHGVNDSGQVVGWSSEFSDLSGRAFLVTPEDSDGDGVPDTWFRDVDGDGANDLMIDLGPLSSAEAINFSGQVVGWSTVHNARHAVLWEVDELDGVTLTDLGKVKGASSATSINDAGQVVGHGQIWPHKFTAFLWENGTMTKLVDMLANSEGIHYLTAHHINEFGEIVGTIYGDGYQHAYIALPIPAAP